ncbi:histone-lysine N-methyltransferase SETMAR [Trichonephila clavipes]|uniref:Histone-lysine N-methyltransferase SETMAR n=1 Tax=Trichonephila clavipes TaxID=2585209 RepID=A0A8X6VD99_TRICX|nr:histone-lysine N-methyltransferase SETMAR [Trichonephila clavipes]
MQVKVHFDSVPCQLGVVRGLPPLFPSTHLTRGLAARRLCLEYPFAAKLLQDNTTINSEVYCHQLDKLKDSLKQKRSEWINKKGVVFHQDNARPHTNLATLQKLSQLEWDIPPHPPYSPDLKLSDYYVPLL